MTVAVIDTGITAHPDLDMNVLPGYDFVSDATAARDGNGRDAHAQDQGDWYAAGECGQATAGNSSWHGTHVAGTIAAVTGNATGVAGIAPNAKVVPVRVLAKCGGSLSDIADAIIWSAGGTVPAFPANANPATAINMSLGGSGACGSTYQAAINSAVSRGHRGGGGRQQQPGCFRIPPGQLQQRCERGREQPERQPLLLLQLLLHG
ncbi:extracellular protease [Arthrobacter sp. Hiyo4]|nr:extracellular protease [Arthrobacter sp. Hiyo4]